MSSVDPDDFVRTQTILRPVALVPELWLFQAERMTPLWTATEAVLARAGIDPPFWAFAWAGGQALARTVLDQPSQR